MAHPEKEKVQKGISRREFLRKFLIGGAFLGVAFLALKYEVKRNFEKFPDFTVLPPEYPAPSELTGINLNCPFLWREIDFPEKIEKAIKNAKQFGAKSIRVFINDEFEPELGKYHLEVLDKIKKLAQRYPLEVTLFDAYPLLHAHKFNPVYGSSLLSSPYLGERLNFFTDKSLQKIFLKRVKNIVEYLNHLPGIIAWSVANELEPPNREREEARRILTSWYEEAIKAIREIDPKRPILSGVANPTLLNEERLKECGLSANTIHLYPNPTENAFKLYQTEQQKALPLICQEIGFPSKLFGFSFSFVHDELLSRFLSDTLFSFFEINEKERWLRPKITSLGLWRLSFDRDSHQDGFEIIPEKLPQTLKILQIWKQIIEKV